MKLNLVKDNDITFFEGKNDRFLFQIILTFFFGKKFKKCFAISKLYLIQTTSLHVSDKYPRSTQNQQ